MLKEFRPTLLFLGKFAGFYFIVSFIYGLYIQSFQRAEPPQPDHFSIVASQHTVAVLKLLDTEWAYAKYPDEASVLIYKGDESAVSVFEGCNGVNLAILFVAFIIAFGGSAKAMAVYIPLGLLFIHLSNILRIGLLSLISMQKNEQAFYFFHKFGFTGIIYGAVFFLWVIWVVRLNKLKKQQNQD